MATIIESGLAAPSEGADTLITNDIIVTGNVIWVDSVNGNDSNAGTENAPLATLSAAVTAATDDNGDVIVIKSGHTETITTQLSISKSALKIFGIGNGSSAPRFTTTGVTLGLAMIAVTGSAVEFNNLYFPVVTGTTAAKISLVTGNSNKIKGCTFLCGASDSKAVILAGTCRIEDCSFEVTADGPDYAIEVSGDTANVVIKDCSFNGGSYNWDNGAIVSDDDGTFEYDTLTLTNGASIYHTGAAHGMMSNIIADDGSLVQA